MGKNETAEGVMVEVTGDNRLPAFFTGLFGCDARIRVRVGCSIRDVLCGQCGVPEHYLDHRIQTVFLNGKAVDNVDDSIVSDGAALALSAAMPGLAGATLRKGGRYAAMRRQISHRSAASCAAGGEGLVVIKLFNMILRELGPRFLSLGIRVRGEDLAAVFSNAPARFREHCRTVTVDGVKINRDQWPEPAGLNGPVWVTVKNMDDRS